ncbi:ATP-dependent Clp protease proteolytic subunit-related protein 2, chloroplastic isoform X2 [Rhododendron vialii]|uniref:ATP-dependent Clp protease proteolytic subunit-related protein 2, chloroplastic isoform X2 n=1 Tax=Rhododendron vialii TaxID=182163 RepID=UPI00265FA973|nr:ATP-dependent Clp protease proteolytic subunit-related protein 2, chloroplastic isoform X2 [Rhododendron vialii]
MAVSFHTPTSTSYLHSGIGLPPPRVFVRFKHQSPGPFCVGKPNSQFAFRTKVISSNQSRSSGRKPTRRLVKMMLEMETPMIKRKIPGGGTESVDLWSFLEGERIFVICEDIDEDLSDELQTLLLHFDSQNSDKPFLFIFDCLGGNVHPCLQIYDTLQYLESPIATHCIATAANMAAFLLAAGDKGKRSASPHSMIVLQPLAGAVDGQVDLI